MKPYESCASRLEQRGWHPPTKQYVDGLVDALVATGVEAVIHSAVSQDCQPLFPSAVFPHCHPEASLESFRYLLERLHGIGRPVLSWYSLNHSSSIVQAHPDSRMVPLASPAAADLPADFDHTHCCINSPYGDLLPRFCREIVETVGFDGVWFDGNTFALRNAAPGCVCEFCRQRFHDDTGLALPVRLDFDSRDFRVWVNWRYDRWTATWRALHEAIQAGRPGATMAVNNYRRRRDHRTGGWETAIPLRRLDLDILMSGELDLHSLQGDFQMKMHRAYRCRRGQDSWLALSDHWTMWTPDVETVPIQQAAVSCAGGGGVLWMGSGTDPALVPATGATAHQTMAPLLPHVAGDPVPYAAIWVSQQTQDFHYRTEPRQAWDDWHGANELCLHAHVQSEVVFDDDVTAGRLSRYPVLLAGNAACLTREQATQLTAYVGNGGVLVALADCGTRNELGDPHDGPVLDHLLGIVGRQPGDGTAVLELADSGLVNLCGRWVTCHRAPHVLAQPAAGVELLAQVVDQGEGPWDDREKRGQPATRHPGLWVRRHGQGATVYLGANLFGSHLRAPTTFQVKLFRALCERLAPPPIWLEAPLAVTMNTRTRPNGSWAVHLHNAPGTVWRYPTFAFNSGELVATRDIVIRVRDRHVSRAQSALSGTSYPIDPNGRRVTVPVLERNDVVLLELAP